MIPRPLPWYLPSLCYWLLRLCCPSVSPFLSHVHSPATVGCIMAFPGRWPTLQSTVVQYLHLAGGTYHLPGTRNICHFPPPPSSLVPFISSERNIFRKSAPAHFDSGLFRRSFLNTVVWAFCLLAPTLFFALERAANRMSLCLPARLFLSASLPFCLSVVFFFFHSSRSELRYPGPFFLFTLHLWKTLLRFSRPHGVVLFFSTRMLFPQTGLRIPLPCSPPASEPVTSHICAWPRLNKRRPRQLLMLHPFSVSATRGLLPRLLSVESIFPLFSAPLLRSFFRSPYLT